jgi:hypothetical protein
MGAVNKRAPLSAEDRLAQHEARLEAIVARVAAARGAGGYEGELVAIDPGPEQSAWVEVGSGGVGRPPRLVGFGLEPNGVVLARVPSWVGRGVDRFVLEMVASYGMAVGAEVFETVFWIGRFYEALAGRGVEAERMFRREVKIHLCGVSSAKDSNVHQAILDMYPRVGGGKVPQVGTKGQPGPLFGVTGDVWAALGVGITAYERGRKS